MKLFRQLKNERGAALMMALTSLMILVAIALEVSFETKVEYIASSQRVNRLQAQYAARSAVELSLLRIQLYKKALASFGESLGDNKSVLDTIWQFPFAWPPVAGERATGVTEDNLQSAIDASLMDAQYMVSISSEGRKLDINDLGSANEGLAAATKEQVLQIFRTELDNNEDFYEDYVDFNFEELVNHMIDWVDEDSESLVGGDERNYYEDQLESDFIPPNQPFKTISELHMVKGMSDALFDILEPKITTYGTKGINVNYAEKDMLKAIDPQITDEVVQKIMERRQNADIGGLFRDEEDFISYLGLAESSFNPSGIPLLFDAEFNFRIKAIGLHRNATTEITAITYDFESLKGRMVELLDEQDKQSGQGDGQGGQGQDQGSGTQVDSGAGDSDAADGDEDEKAKAAEPKGRPRVVYWRET